MGTTDEELVDWSRLAELKSEIGEDDFDEVMEIFLEECDGNTDGLVASDALEQDLHFLRGAAMNLGLEALASACQAGERAAARGQGDGVDRAAIVALYRTSRARLLSRERREAA